MRQGKTLLVSAPPACHRMVQPETCRRGCRIVSRSVKFLAIIAAAVAISCSGKTITPYSPYKTQTDKEIMDSEYNQFLAQWPAPYKSEMVQTSLGATHVLVNGPEDGRPVILLHGAMANALMWKDVVRALQPSHRTIAVDIIGHFGKSVPSKTSIKEEELVKWVDDILDHFALDQVDVIGTSFGGWLALKYSIVSNKRLNRLVLIATAPASPKFSLSFMLKSIRMMVNPTDKNVEESIEYMLSPGSKADEGIVKFMKEALIRGNPLMPRPSKFAKDDVSTIKQPVLVLTGEYDKLFEPEKVAKYSNQYFHDVRVIEIKDAGHFLFYEKPEEINQHITAFLDQKVIDLSKY